MKLVYERSRPGRRGGRVPAPGVEAAEVPAELRRAAPPRLPEIAEPDLVRHFTELSTRTFGIDTGFYPLGSCTMKYNPRVNERAAGLAGFRDLHPHQDPAGAQGALELMWRLERMLAEVVGLDAVTLQPAAGSQGELTGLMLVRAYFAERGEGERRRKIVIPDTAHGTNPASVTMAGYELEKVATDARGNLDLDDLRGKVNDRTAGLMLTNPSTLGLFDEGIEEVARIFHDAGALLYYDGANLNAVVGISRPGESAHLPDRLRPVVVVAERFAVPHDRGHWEKRLQHLADRHRPAARPAAAVRLGEGLVEVVVDDVEAVSYTHLTLPTNREV